jgi:hypothetical protein
MGGLLVRGIPFTSNLTLLTMTDSPFESNIHVKRKIEPAEGLSLWFADVPEGGLAEDTFLFWCVFLGFNLPGR